MIVVEDYTFTPGIRGAGTIVIPEVIELEDIQRIWNVTRGALIYEATNSQYGIVSIAVANGSTTLTIETDTTTMNAADDLQILLYDGTGGGGGGDGAGADGAIDAFGRQRVSEGYTLADYKSVYGADSEMLSATNGAGSSVAYQTNTAAARLTAGTGATAYAQRQSRMYHNYQPGKSQLIFASFNFFAAQENCNKRIGYFDDRDGVFLQLAGDGTLSFVMRSYVTGAAVDGTPVTQANWNVDPCDGAGPSGFDLNVAKTQLLFIDFQWLGVGRVRVGFVHDGVEIIAHEFYHSNDLTTVYWSQPSLPIRAEVRNTAGTAAATYMDMICSTVISEGGYAEAGNDFSAGTAVRSVGNASATLPVLAIKLTPTLNTYPNRQYVRLSAINVVAPAQIVKVEIIRVESETSITGGGWVTGGSGSGVEYNSTATGYTSGANDLVIDTFYLPSGGVGGGNNNAVPITLADPTKARKGYIAQSISANDSQAFLVLVTSLGNNATAAAAFQWREIG